MVGEGSILASAVTALVLSGLATLPAVHALGGQIRRRSPKDHFYRDEDGSSTPETVAAFSNKASKTIILLLSALALASSVAAAALNTVGSSHSGLVLESWLVTGSWAVVLLQAILLAAHRSPVQVHDLGLWAFFSCLITLAATLFQVVDAGRHVRAFDDTPSMLRLVNGCLGFGLLFACLSIPRRPRVFYKGKPVDDEWTVSAINRLTWTWAGALLKTARGKGDLDARDIPQPDHQIRAQNLVAAWPDTSLQGKLLRSIVRAYGWRLVLQWIISIGRCLLGVMPFWAMLRLVQSLERKTSGEFSAEELWLVLFMGVCTMGEQWIDGWVVWYAITRLCIPARGQLSALVFEKSLRRKNVRAAGKPDEEAADDKDGDDKSEGSDSTQESSVTKSRQAIVNLVGVDSKHISDFLMIQFYIINSIGKLVIYSAFLVQLIGWLPYGAGILAWALVLPVNTWVSKLYIDAEDGLMKTRDGKLAVVNEALLGMRQIKFSALESQWEDKILKMRATELGKIRRVFAADTILFFCWVASPILLAAASLAVYASVHGILSPSVAFVSVGIFKSLEVSLSALPELLASGLDTLVSIRRIETYLSGPEIKQTLSEGVDVALDNATIAWPVDAEVADEDRFVLRDVDLTFPAGELSVISGKTGSGKSLLLNALIGEADLLGGTIYMPRTTPALQRNDGKAHPGNWILAGSVAYVGQSPWLESASFRDNILFGLPLLQDRYDKVLDACALKRDLEILTDGDQTELGANGVNLSGGQKWRVTLARAIYSRAEILVMDDIFSAVDAHVGRQIFEQCIAGDVCRGRTRILVTHHVTLVQSHTKYLVELGDGTVSHHGLLSELAEDTLQKIKSHEQTETETGGKRRARRTSGLVQPGPASASDPASGETSMEVPPAVPPKAGKQFIVDEAREKGMVKKHVYATYMRSSGGSFFWIVCALIYAAFEAGNLGRNWWLQKWTNETQTKGAAAHQHGMAYGLSLQHSTQHAPWYKGIVAQEDPKSLSFYLGVYVALATASGIVGTLRFLWSFVMSIKASKALFERILYTVLRTKLRWIDTVPVGRILNRLTADFDIIDNKLTVDFGFLFWRLLGLLGIIVAAILVSTSILPLAAILILIAGFVGKRFMEGARPVKRLESNAKSPVFELFNATLAGVSLLRAFHKTGVYVDRMYVLLDSWDSLSIHVWLLNRWLGIRMALVGTVFTTLVGVIVVVSPLVDAAMAGFTLSFALDFSGNMLMAIRGYATLELDMNAAERIVEYTEVETEDQGGDDPPAAWPTSGRVEVQDLVAAYAADLPPVLKGVSFEIADNERVGVIGRTGAGKSSLTLALFRFIEARSGRVLIDGLDIADISLGSLRSRLAIIPQDPVLFSGTVRSNLDPFNQHTDDELRDSLSRVHLIGSEPGTPSPEAGSGSESAPQNTNIFRDLYSGISESGGNLSQGQRQLLCIARAIVSRPKIMVLDEATSAVDMATDALIQRSIREQFGDSTLIVIAHRLSTIADFDRILVLDDGRVEEFGSPKELWHRPGGLFRAMCDHSGEKDRLVDVITGRSS
ncbi:ABC transporter, transmembrane domain, type 1 [Ophiocordyceps camponoti-floridani]|uniref:ABC transporter, transmembrane domain, type 1 n=1 Tax=Ophiocordyceps camponoti-floridani TaxID=2030778 RepID=A0A8H4QA72_9HYPO|nr:ABC transporter, transmembrane domain, type 1 [Ophiocordyceps camponoti-floridani]